MDGSALLGQLHTEPAVTLAFEVFRLQRSLPWPSAGPLQWRTGLGRPAPRGLTLALLRGRSVSGSAAALRKELQALEAQLTDAGRSLDEAGGGERSARQARGTS